METKTKKKNTAEKYAHTQSQKKNVNMWQSKGQKQNIVDSDIKICIKYWIAKNFNIDQKKI